APSNPLSLHDALPIFLHFALAENKVTGIDCFAHNLRGMGLANSNQLNVGHLSSGDLRRLCDLILHAVKNEIAQAAQVSGRKVTRSEEHTSELQSRGHL